MVTLYREIREALLGLWSLVVGLGVTGKYFLQRTVTVHYPRETVDNLSTYRGHIELVAKPKDPTTAKCILCGMCQMNCPSGCIKIKQHTEEVDAPPPKAKPGEEGEEAKEPPKKKKVKVMDAYMLDFNYCSLCGICVQTCPVNSLKFSNDVYIAGYSRDDFVYDLLARMRGSAGKPASGGDES